MIQSKTIFTNFIAMAVAGNLFVVSVALGQTSGLSSLKGVEWADTGHMTIDGKLEAGIHPQEYGLNVPYLDINANNSYVYALLTLVSHLQRGNIPEGQMKWLYERAIASAVPRNYIEEFMAFDHRKANLEQYMISSGGDSIARVLLYDTAQMIAYGDRYDRRHRSSNAYRKIYSTAAKILEISPGLARSIITIVKQEVRLLEKKTRVFWGETPYTPPKQ
jgi:hypothetical protein